MERGLSIRKTCDFEFRENTLPNERPRFRKTDDAAAHTAQWFRKIDDAAEHTGRERMVTMAPAVDRSDYGIGRMATEDSTARFPLPSCRHAAPTKSVSPRKDKRSQIRARRY